MLYGLVMEHDKLEIFDFSRTHNSSNPELNLSVIRVSTLNSKTHWIYLGFYFDHCLFFKKHIYYDFTKVLSTVKAISILGNLTRSLLLLQKQLLYYYSCLVPIVTYSFQL